MSDNPFTWSIAKPQEVLHLVSEKPLKAEAFDVKLATANVDVQYPVPDDNSPKVSLKAGVETSVRSFFKANKDKPDDDQVIADKPTGSDESQPTAPLLFDGQNAWIKYAATFTGKVAVGVELPYVSPEGSTEISFHVADYHHHQPGESARAAVTHDVTKLRAPFLFEHVKKLGHHEALCLRASAKLGLHVDVKWSDIFALGLPALAEALHLSSTVGLSIKAELFTSAGIAFQDDFLFVISREAAGTFLVSVRKAPTHSWNIGLGARISVGLSDDTVKAAVDAVTGLIDQLPAPEKAEALAALGAGSLDDAATKKIGGLVKGIAAKKISAGFSAEYSSIHDYTSLLELRLTEPELAQHFDDVMSGKLTKLDKELHDKVLRGFYRNRLTRTRAWGFELALADWKLSSTDKTVTTATRQYRSLNGTGPYKVSYELSRAYETKIGTTVPIQSSLTLKAASTSYKDRPMAADLSYGLHLLLYRKGKLPSWDINVLVDQALTWNVLEPDAQIIHEVTDFIAGHEIEARLEMKIDDDAFRRLLIKWSPTHHEQLARALARAMPWTSGRPGPDGRASIYQGLWLAYLKDEGKWSLDDLRKTAAKQVPNSEPGLQNYELHGAKNGPDVSFTELATVGTVHGNLRPAALWERWNLPSNATLSHDGGLNVGMQELFYSLIHPDAVDHTVVPGIFTRTIQPLSGQAFHLMSIGAYALELAPLFARPVPQIERTLTVTAAGKTKVFGPAH